MVMAVDTPVDRPAGVLARSACRNTGSENIAPIATQPSRPPAATITQRYGLSTTACDMTTSLLN